MTEAIRKIVVNRCYGGFGLSDAALHLYAEKKGLTLYPEKSPYGLTTYWTVAPENRLPALEGKAWGAASMEERKAYNAFTTASQIHDFDITRDDEALVSAIETLGSSIASGPYARLQIVEIPSEVEWDIEEHDGREWVAEKHRTW